jgi:CRISPR-associated protein Cmr4
VDDDIVVDKKNVVLEEFCFTVKPHEQVTQIAKWLADHAFPSGDEYKYFRNKVQRSLVILPEDDFRDFTQFATEVVTRIRIDQEKKTVAGGALWSEEHLPSDTLLYAPLYASRPRTDKSPNGLKTAEGVLKFVRDLKLDRIQLGGDETVGRGIVKLRFGGA